MMNKTPSEWIQKKKSISFSTINSPLTKTLLQSDRRKCDKQNMKTQQIKRKKKLRFNLNLTHFFQSFRGPSDRGFLA